MTKAQVQAIQESIVRRQEQAKLLDNYKEMLSMFKAAGIPWASASHDVIAIELKGVKASRENYKEINKLRDWYNEEEV